MTIAHEITGPKYRTVVEDYGFGLYYRVRYINVTTGWNCIARTRGYADYETHSLKGAIAKAKKVHAEVNR